MLFGEKNNFAIDISVDSALSDAIYGGITFWVCGNRVGDIREDISISIAIAQLRHLFTYKGKRQDKDLYSLKADQIFSRVDMAIYGDNDRSDFQVAVDTKYYSRFIAFPEVSSFDTTKAFLVEWETTAKFIYRYNMNLHQGNITAGSFDEAIYQLIDSFSKRYPMIIKSIDRNGDR